MYITDEASAALRKLHIDIRAGHHHFSEDLVLNGPCHAGGGIHSGSLGSIGAFSYSVSPLSGSISRIGRYCSFGSGITFGEMEHPTAWLSTSSFTYDSGFIWGAYTAERASLFSPPHLPFEKKRGGIEVGNDVWIGARSYIRGGVSIAHGAIIGAHTVITKDVPPYAVVAGNPGRIIKYRFSEPAIERLLASNWWNFDYTDLAGIDLTDPDAALEEISRREQAGQMTPYQDMNLRLVNYSG